MNIDRDSREDERILTLPCCLPIEHQSQQILQGSSLPNSNEEVEQGRHMKKAFFTNPFVSEDLASQEIEVDDDPELAAIVARLRETASYAINPTLKEKLRKGLLQQFMEHRTV